jgi:CRP/FNR family transcriptional regulator, cyclic AMP receptor protein
MLETNSVKSTTKNPTKLAKATARLLLSHALGFRDCAPTTLDVFVENGILKNLQKGEVLTHHGAPFKWLCLIVRGDIETSVVRQDGHRHLVGLLQAGDLAGLVGLIDDLGHVNDLISRSSDTTVLLIPASIINELRLLDSNLGRAFELQLAFRSRLLYERLSADPSMPVELRLARLILTLAGLYGTKVETGTRIDINISQVDLADWLGVSRQRVNLAVQQLKASKLIGLSYSKITVTNYLELQKIASLF